MIINEETLFNNFLGKNKNKKIFIGIDNSINSNQYNQFLHLFNLMNFEFILYDCSKVLEKEINNFNDIVYVLLVKNDIHLNYVKNDSRIFIFKLSNMPLPLIKISNITNIINFNAEIKNFTLLNAYVQYMILNPNLYIGISKMHGFGLYTSKKILKEQYIFSLNGKVLNEDFINNENFTGEWNALKSNMYLVRKDRTSYGFINHSRNPNCEIDISTMKVVSKTIIHKNEELFLDYRKEPLSTDYINKFGKNYL